MKPTRCINFSNSFLE